MPSDHSLHECPPDIRVYARAFSDPNSGCIIEIKKPWNYCNSKVFLLVGMTGFEPAAFASRTQRSTKLSHIPFSANIIIIVQLHNFGKYFFRFVKDFVEVLQKKNTLHTKKKDRMNYHAYAAG